MYYVENTYWGFLVLDVLMLVIAVVKIVGAMGAKKEAQDMAKSNQQQNNQGYDPLLYSNNTKDKKKAQQQQQQQTYQYGQYAQPYGGQPGYNNGYNNN